MDRDEYARKLELVALRAAVAAHQRIAVAHIATLLVFGDDDQHQRGIDLARELDEAGLNVDLDVDAWARRHGHASWQDIWQPPKVRAVEGPPF